MVLLFQCTCNDITSTCISESWVFPCKLFEPSSHLFVCLYLTRNQQGPLLKPGPDRTGLDQPETDEMLVDPEIAAFACSVSCTLQIERADGLHIKWLALTLVNIMVVNSLIHTSSCSHACVCKHPGLVPGFTLSSIWSLPKAREQGYNSRVYDCLQLLFPFSTKQNGALHQIHSTPTILYAWLCLHLC